MAAPIQTVLGYSYVYTYMYETYLIDACIYVCVYVCTLGLKMYVFLGAEDSYLAVLGDMCIYTPKYEIYLKDVSRIHVNIYIYMRRI